MQRKNLIKALACGVCGLGLSATSALAGDECFDKGSLTLGDCYGYDWTGPYIGAHAGYTDADLSGGYNTQQPAEGLFASDLEPEGFSYGLQVGYNLMMGDFVLGVELDGTLIDEDDQISKGLPDIQSMTAEVNAYGSLRAKLGFPVDNLLPFVTGGVGLVDYEIFVNDVSNGATFKADETAFAGVVGGGMEWGVSREVTLRAEGLYYYVAEGHDFVEPGANQATTTTFEDLWTLRGGVNWRF